MRLVVNVVLILSLVLSVGVNIDLHQLWVRPRIFALAQSTRPFVRGTGWLSIGRQGRKCRRRPDHSSQPPNVHFPAYLAIRALNLANPSASAFDKRAFLAAGLAVEARTDLPATMDFPRVVPVLAGIAILPYADLALTADDGQGAKRRHASRSWQARATFQFAGQTSSRFERTQAIV